MIKILKRYQKGKEYFNILSVMNQQDFWCEARLEGDKLIGLSDEQIEEFKVDKKELKPYFVKVEKIAKKFNEITGNYYYFTKDGYINKIYLGRTIGFFIDEDISDVDVDEIKTMEDIVEQIGEFEFAKKLTRCDNPVKVVKTFVDVPVNSYNVTYFDVKNNKMIKATIKVPHPKTTMGKIESYISQKSFLKIS
jgi:hypothetical protein